MGKNNVVHPFASVGTEPEDYAFHDIVSYTQIGDNNRFREGVTINRGTHENTVTKIGDGCFMMANTHVAHNCQLGNRVIMVPFSGLAGYCEIGDNCLISGLSGMHQFCRMGRMAVLSGGSQISMDLPPFMIGDGRNGGVRGFNIVGLRRNGFSPDTIKVIKEIYNIFFRSGLNTTNAIAKVEAELPQLPEVLEFLEFVKSSKRGILPGDHHGRRA
jgi:UDP-N-acetylglucosamine acyltransferase